MFRDKENREKEKREKKTLLISYLESFLLDAFDINFLTKGFAINNCRIR